MKRKLKYLLAVAAGFWGGLLTAQALIGAYARGGSNFGAEPITLLALPLLIACGCVFGRDTQNDKLYHRGYEKGWQDSRNRAETTCRIVCKSVERADELDNDNMNGGFEDAENHRRTDGA